MIKAVQKYGEGSIFAVPLGHDLYAIGLITRRKPRSPICFGYFYGPPVRGFPKMAEGHLLTKETAVHKCLFGDLGLLNGSWPVIGKLKPWNRDEWPLPLFFREEPFLGRIFVVQYSDENPGKFAGQYLVDAIPPGAIKDSLSGFQAVEIRLRQAFGLSEPQ